MKRLITKIMLCLFILLGSHINMAYAASASASLSGPSTLRAGDTITLTFKVNGSEIYGISGNLSYDSSKVSLVSIKQTIAKPWVVEPEGNKFLAYDDKLTTPINSSKSVFTATFKVKNLSVGDNVSISVKGMEATVKEGSNYKGVSVSNVTYSKNVAAPLSTDNTLKSLTVSNATISPAFSSSVTSYSTSVPYSTSKLSINAVANNSKASVSISNNNLKANATTKVTVTVKAENGSTKTYTISVKRAADPNYVPSDINTLKSLKVDGYVLSPVFDTNKDSYIVWLPYETSSINVSATLTDSKGEYEVVGNDNLETGKDNTVKVIVKAENGDENTYTIIAKRAAAHNVEDTPVTPDAPVVDNTTNNPSGDIMTYGLVLVAGIAIGFVAGMFINKKTKK